MPRPIETPSTGAKTDLQAAEKRGYSKGYSAGLRRQLHNRREASEARLERILLLGFSLVAITLSPRPWKRGNKDLVTVDDYVRTASDMADGLRRMR